jgi:hypothetical protein
MEGSVQTKRNGKFGIERPRTILFVFVMKIKVEAIRELFAAMGKNSKIKIWRLISGGGRRNYK